MRDPFLKKVGRRSKYHRLTLLQLLEKVLKGEKYLAVSFNCNDISLNTLLGKHGFKIVRRKTGEKFVLIPLERLPPSLNTLFGKMGSKRKKARWV